MRLVRLLLFLVAVGGGSALAGDAKSGGPTDPKWLYDEGTKAFNLGNFDKAVERYRAAYELRPDAVLLYNIAQSYRLGQDLNKAIFFYRSYLRASGKAPNRAEVEERIRKLEAQLAEQREPPNAAVPPGQTPSATTDEPPVRPRPAAAVPPVQTVAEPPPPVPTVSSSVATTPRDSADKRSSAKKPWLWGVVGGVAVVVVGVGLGVGLGLGLRTAGAPSSHFGTADVFALRF